MTTSQNPDSTQKNLLIAAVIASHVRGSYRGEVAQGNRVADGMGSDTHKVFEGDHHKEGLAGVIHMRLLE